MSEPLKGNCYATTEALYHLLGGKTNGWQPFRMMHEGVSHWFLWNHGVVLDPTVWQFKTAPDYFTAKRAAFLTTRPSKRASDLMVQMAWNLSPAKPSKPSMKAKRRTKPQLPRVPLPRQTGGSHRTRRNELDRKAKHRPDYRSEP